MTAGYADRIEAAFREQDPIPALKAIAMDMSKDGLGKKAVYAEFLEHYQLLQHQKRAREEDILGDVLDMISDSFSRGNPNNMDLPP